MRNSKSASLFTRNNIWKLVYTPIIHAVSIPIPVSVVCVFVCLFVCLCVCPELIGKTTSPRKLKIVSRGNFVLRQRSIGF